MIVIDALLFISWLFLILGAYLLADSWKERKALKKQLELLSDEVVHRDHMIKRLLHEAERHGCDDGMLITEAKAITSHVVLEAKYGPNP